MLECLYSTLYFLLRGEGMEIELLLSIGAMALLDTLSPAVLGISVYMLLTPRKNSKKLLLIYLFTVAVFYFTVGLILMLGLESIMTPISNALDSDIVRIAMTIVGGALFVGSWFVPKKDSSQPNLPKSMGVITMILLGVSTSLLEVATAIPYFAAIGIMTKANLTMALWLPILIGYNLIMILPSILLIVFQLIVGRWSRFILEKINNSFSKSEDSALSWVMCIVGLILFVNGTN